MRNKGNADCHRPSNTGRTNYEAMTWGHDMVDKCANRRHVNKRDICIVSSGRDCQFNSDDQAKGSCQLWKSSLKTKDVYSFPHMSIHVLDS